MKISLIHPSRSRPEKSAATIEKWFQRAASRVYELIVSIDADDPLAFEYEERCWRILKSNNRSAVDAINNAAKIATGDIFIVVSDDTDCPNGWDEKIVNSVQGKSDYLLRVNDGIQRWIVTMTVMDRAYYNRFGYIYNPEYLHCFADTEMTHVADITGRIVAAPHLSFPHLHYCKGLAQRDAINERADATWEQGKRVYLNRFRQSFGLTGVDPWRISDDSHQTWLRKALR